MSNEDILCSVYTLLYNNIDYPFPLDQIGLCANIAIYTLTGEYMDTEKIIYDRNIVGRTLFLLKNDEEFFFTECISEKNTDAEDIYALAKRLMYCSVICSVFMPDYRINNKYILFMIEALIRYVNQK